MRTALTVITTAILTAIAFLLAWQQGLLGNMALGNGGAACTTAGIAGDIDAAAEIECITIEDGLACETPWGTMVNHAQPVLSFATEVASGDVVCEGMTSICNNGSWLNNEAPHPYASCDLEANILTPKNCAIGDIMVAHDSTNTFYREIKNGSTYTYEAQQRYCFDGELDGDAVYTKLNLLNGCTLNVVEVEEKEEVIEEEAVVVPTLQPIATPSQPREPVYARCTAPFGGIWTHGQGGTAYTQASVPYGSTCSAVSVVCGFGSIRYGSAENIGSPVSQELFANCSIGEPVGCTSACGDVPHNGKITTYSSSSLPYGSSDTCNDVEIRSTCTNGSLSPVGGSACSCEVSPPAGCVAPNGQQIAHGSSITLYKDKEIQPVAWDGSDTCVRQGGKCENGVWYDWNGNQTSLTFRYSTCTILPPPAGEGPGGEGVPQG